MITDIARLASVNEILLFYMRAKLRKGWFINVGVFRDANSKKSSFEENGVEVGDRDTRRFHPAVYTVIKFVTKI